jgi:transcriptional regulator with XRE-family HTH domain
MTENDAMTLFRQKIEDIGQAEVARLLGYSRSTINQILHGSYRGGLNPVLTRVEEVFGTTTVECPVLGIIRLGVCAEHRNAPFAATNAQRVRLWKECRRCRHNQR